MREIKFRAWNIILNCYHESTIDLEVDRSGIYTIDSGNIFVMEQFIGKKDRNDKEIYEGDIFRMKSCDMYCVVKWDEKKSRFVCKGLRSEIRMCMLSDYIIIGNKYENPELILEKYLDKEN